MHSFIPSRYDIQPTKENKTHFDGLVNFEKMVSDVILTSILTIWAPFTVSVAISD